MKVAISQGVRTVLIGSLTGFAAATFLAWSFRIFMEIPASAEASAATGFIQWVGLAVGFVVGAIATIVNVTMEPTR